MGLSGMWKMEVSEAATRAESHFFRMFHFPRKMQTSVAKLSSKIGARNFGE
jgi:hypothetical protein